MTRGESADFLVVDPEAPAPQTRPGEIFHRVAHAGAFPIEDRTETTLIDHDVAVADIAVHDHAARRRTRLPLLQPTQREREHGSRLEQTRDLQTQILERAFCRRDVRQRLKVRRRFAEWYCVKLRR